MRTIFRSMGIAGLVLGLTVLSACGDDSPGGENICDDGIDNDGDGQIDCADSDCLTATMCDATEFDCDDSFDNDGDGDVDCADSDCGGDPACGETNCSDGQDNDMDGQTDCADSDCVGNAACIETNCTDTLDNDNDGDIDCADSDCVNDAACQEDCDDGADNDLDGDTDCADSDCSSESFCGTTEIDCADAFDNDGDGDIDCADTDCADDPACSQNCMQILGCVQNCGMDFTCMGNCSNAGCESASTAWNGLSNCLTSNCVTACMGGVDSPACLQCLNSQCGDEVNSCITNSCEDIGEYDCENGVDDDTDGDTDCADSDCALEPVCGGSGDTCGELMVCANACQTDLACMSACRADGCLTARVAYDEITNCMADYCLGDCIVNPTGNCNTCLGTNCWTELADCVSDHCQTAEETECGDATDNDGDSDIDCDDSDCAADPICNSTVELDCEDGISNDNDSDIDCADSDCTNHIACNPSVGWTCGEIQACVYNCGTDMTCGNTCITGGCTSAQTAYNDVIACMFGACMSDCLADPQSTACATCAATSCGTEATACGANTCP